MFWRCDNSEMRKSSDAHATETRRAYDRQVRQFSEWCKERGVDYLDWSAEALTEYLLGPMAEKKWETINQFCAAVKDATRADRSPFRDPALQDVIDLLRESKAGDKKQRPRFTRSQVHSLAENLVADSEEKRCRDRAIIFCCHYGDLRREDVVQLDIGDVIPDGPAAQAVEVWLKMSGIRSGAMFREVTRYGSIKSPRLSGKAVDNIVKDSAHMIGCGSRYSAESLRPRLPQSEQIQILRDRLAVYRQRAFDEQLRRQRVEAENDRLRRQMEHLKAAG